MQHQTCGATDKNKTKESPDKEVRREANATINRKHIINVSTVCS
jgi:hypothetical protein